MRTGTGGGASPPRWRPAPRLPIIGATKMGSRHDRRNRQVSPALAKASSPSPWSPGAPSNDAGAAPGGGPRLAALEPGWTTIAPGGETSCALGTAFEFHVKPGASDKLFVFLNGGGACWTGAQCSLEEEPTPYIPTSQIDHNDRASRKASSTKTMRTIR